MNPLENSRRVWEALARSDPYWAVCTDPRKQDGKWNAPGLLATGVFEVGTVLSLVRGSGLSITCNGKVLDFGCGVGQLTQALSRYFAECYGVDISSGMVCTGSNIIPASPPLGHFLGVLSRCRLLVCSDGSGHGGHGKPPRRQRKQVVTQLHLASKAVEKTR
jgi:SAM-dependent methyltransferase